MPPFPKAPWVRKHSDSLCCKNDQFILMDVSYCNPHKPCHHSSNQGCHVLHTWYNHQWHSKPTCSSTLGFPNPKSKLFTFHHPNSMSFSPNLNWIKDYNPSKGTGNFFNDAHLTWFVLLSSSSCQGWPGGRGDHLFFCK